MVSLITVLCFIVLQTILNISAEISTNVNKEHRKSTLTSPCHYCKEELVCDNCTTNGRIDKLPVSTGTLESGMNTLKFIYIIRVPFNWEN